jgi:DGQHR domain-containing protein
VFVLPPEEYLYVTDGQHRLEALRQAITQKPELEHDSVGVTIIEEANIDKVHQDFFDAAQVKPLAKALLVEYDGCEPVNWLAREVGNSVRVFKDRVERLGNVGKNSLMLFTTNQVKQGVLQLVVGDWSLYGDAMHKQAEQAVGPAKDLWKERLINFFNEFTPENDQWREVAERPLASGLSTDVPGMREKYLHFTGAGLLVLCGVGHTILEFNGSPNGRLTTDQKDLVRRLCVAGLVSPCQPVAGLPHRAAGQCDDAEESHHPGRGEGQESAGLAHHCQGGQCSPAGRRGETCRQSIEVTKLCRGEEAAGL